MSRQRQHLELHGGKYRVTVAVPRDLHKKLGTRLKRPLHTDSLLLANRLKPQVVAELKSRIDQARGLAGKRPDALMREAVEVARYLKAATNPVEVDELHDAILEREEALSGGRLSVAIDPETGDPAPHWESVPTKLSTTFGSIARGEATPIEILHGQYLSKSIVKSRTKSDDIRAVSLVKTWCERVGLPAMLESIQRRAAVRFVDGLSELTGGLHPRTQNKYICRLSMYWQYLIKHEVVDIDVWRGLSVKVPATPHSEEERAFTNEEVRLLLVGPANQRMRDLMVFAALTGARLDAIVDLKVRDVMGGVVTFKAQKKERGPRDIPLHPDLDEIVARRVAGKGMKDGLFPEWPAPKKVGSTRERSFKASNEFTAYRRQCGVDEVVPGKRRSLVNFHSFRRWFITRAERAGQNGDLIAAIVGHRRTGITLGRYSEGPEMKRARKCVASVKLPALDVVATEARALTPRKRVEEA